MTRVFDPLSPRTSDDTLFHASFNDDELYKESSTASSLIELLTTKGISIDKILLDVIFIV